ncbi:MAG TPA: MlaD family protein [Mariprofundaceae bacterium]|nr:MlaD family protein [Mariprofundaceae bacterium]
MNPQARLGAFVIVALVLLFFATGKIGEGNWFNPQGSTVETEFDDLLGLDVESPVRMAGVKVGTVQDIYLRDNRAVVRIALKPGVKLPGSTRATIISRGLVGEKNLALTAKPGDTTLLPPGALIPSNPSGDINTFISKASEITDDIRSLTHSLASGVGGKNGEASLQQLIANSNRTVAELKDMLHENRQEIHLTTESMRKTMQALQKELPPILEQLHQSTESISALLSQHRQDLATAASELPKAVTASKEFFTESAAVSHSINSTLMDNQENLYRILFELRKASENLEAFSDDIRRNPWKVLTEKPEVKASPKADRLKMEEMILTTGHMGPAPAKP